MTETTDLTCPSHLPGQPAAKAPREWGPREASRVRGVGPAGRRPASAAPAGRGGAPRACVPAGYRQSRAATEFQDTHLKERA